MQTVKVIWSNGDSTITRINGSRDEIINYYSGQFFNIGIVEDEIVQCVEIIFL